MATGQRTLANGRLPSKFGERNGRPAKKSAALRVGLLEALVFGWCGGLSALKKHTSLVQLLTSSLNQLYPENSLDRSSPIGQPYSGGEQAARATIGQLNWTIRQMNTQRTRRESAEKA